MCHATINNSQLSDMYFSTDWQFGMFKRGKDNGHLVSVYLQIVFLIFSSICCNYTLELPLMCTCNICLFNK